MSLFRKNNLIFSMLALLFSADAIADSTDAEQISQVIYDGSSNDLFFMSTTGTWNTSAQSGTSPCQNAPYVHVRASVSGRQQILSIGLAAYLAGKKVYFVGACSTVPGESSQYFDAYYISIKN